MDKRYAALKSYIESGAVKDHRELFDIIPKSRWIEDTGINWERLSNKIDNPEKFSTKDIIILSNVLNMDDTLIYALISKGVDRTKLVRKKVKTIKATKKGKKSK